MSDEAFRHITKRLVTDREFRKQMLHDSSSTLEKEYRSYQLSDLEKTDLSEMLAAIKDNLQGETERVSWLPSSFKEIGGAVLSLTLLGLLIYAVVNVLRLTNTLPQILKVSDTETQVVDAFSRAKDFFSILFPLFAAVVSFWLGVAIEGKRADENRKTAENESEARATAQENEKGTKIIAAASLTSARDQVQSIIRSQPQRLASGDEERLRAVMDTIHKGLESING